MARQRIDGRTVGTSPSTVHTITNNTQGTAVELRIFNRHSSSSRDLSIWFVPQGSSRGNNNLEFEVELASGEGRFYQWAMAFLGAGDTIQVEASAGSSITLSGGVLEEAV